MAWCLAAAVLLSAGAGLPVLDLASGTWELLDNDATPQDVDFAPRYSPDGRWIVFVRNTPVGDLWRIPATGGTAQRLTRLHADIRGWDWTPDGRGIVLARWSGSESRLLRLDLASGALQDLGVNDGVEPTIAAKASALAFSEVRNYFGVHRVALDGTASGGAIVSVLRSRPSAGDRPGRPAVGVHLGPFGRFRPVVERSTSAGIVASDRGPASGVPESAGLVA